MRSARNALLPPRRTSPAGIPNRSRFLRPGLGGEPVEVLGRVALKSLRVIALIRQLFVGHLPAAPFLHNGSIAANGAISTCGNGSQTVPSCRSPGVKLSKSPRALLTCAIASM